MSEKWILAPVFILAFMTFAVALWLLKCRIVAVKQGLNPSYFVFNRGTKIPAFLQQAEQHYVNLFEMPILFYVGCIVAYSSHTVTMLGVLLAWAYVLSRMLHTYIHLTNNKLRMRRNAFMASYIVLFVFWIWLAMGIF